MAKVQYLERTQDQDVFDLVRVQAVTILAVYALLVAPGGYGFMVIFCNFDAPFTRSFALVLEGFCEW